MTPMHRPPVLPPRPDPLRGAIRAVIALADFGTEPELVEACLDSLERYAKVMGASTADCVEYLENGFDQLAIGLEREECRMLCVGLRLLRSTRPGERMILLPAADVRVAVPS